MRPNSPTKTSHARCNKLILLKLYIVEDYLLTRITYKKALSDYTDIKIMGDFETAEECIDALNNQTVNVILMDLGLPLTADICIVIKLI